ncbi:hypothetical protein AAVH_39031, partial [Aphelenchoides avenae]
ISEGCFNTYVFLVQLVNDYMNLESPPPGPYAVIVLQPKEQWNDYPFYSRILRQLLLYATGPRNAHAGGSLHFCDDHRSVSVVYLPKGRRWFNHLHRLNSPAHRM